MTTLGATTSTTRFMKLVNANETDATGTITTANAITYTSSLAAGSVVLVIAGCGIDIATNADGDCTFTLQAEGATTIDSVRIAFSSTGAGNFFADAGTVLGTYTTVGANATFDVDVTVNAGSATWRVRNLIVLEI